MSVSKKTVSSEELRRLMRQRKTETKINHPLAKYNNVGTLICIACNIQLKSDKLWNPHILGRSHKEKVAALNNKSQQLSNPVKRTIDEQIDNDIYKKKHKAAHTEPAHKPAAEPLKGILKNTTLLTQYSDPDSEEETNPNTHTTEQPTTDNNATLELPADFFDSGLNENTADKADEQVPQEHLPEGFFDDPKADAKARKVEYVDKNEEEWLKFQKEMKEQADVSEKIEQEDTTAVTEDRHLEEIDEQMAQWSRVQQIVDKKEELMKKVNNKTHTDSTESDNDDETDLNDFLDWRSKNLLQ